MNYGYPGQTVPGPGVASHYEPQYQQTGPNGYYQPNNQTRAEPERRASDTYHTQWGNPFQVGSNAPVSTPVVGSSREPPPDWGSARGQDDASYSRRPTRASVSSRSDATTSSSSDASSPRSIAEDLQGLSLGDHPSSQLIPQPGASSRSQRWDPILGDVQRSHDTLVVSFITYSETIMSSAFFSVSHSSLLM